MIMGFVGVGVGKCNEDNNLGIKSMSGAPKGNSNAAKGKKWTDAIRKALARGKKLDVIAKKVVEMAVAGDMQAIKEIGDRLDGKSVQAITGEDGGPLTVEIVRFADKASK